MAAKASNGGPKKDRITPYQNMEAVWTILREKSSKKAPMTAGEIYRAMQTRKMDNPPSRSTVYKLMAESLSTANAMFPFSAANNKDVSLINAYLDGLDLHLVLETPDGTVLDTRDVSLEYTVAPLPSDHGTATAAENLSMEMDAEATVPIASTTFSTYPLMLRCVFGQKNTAGSMVYRPYEEWEFDPARKPEDKTPRKYYLANDLTDAQWRLLYDMVQVYPFLSQEQTARYKAVINHLRPTKQTPLPTHYAYRRPASEKFFQIIDQLNTAIQDRHKVNITYGEQKLSPGKDLKPELKKREKNGNLIVAPYALIWSNGNYYLVAREERKQQMMNLRVDRMLDLAHLKGQHFAPATEFDPLMYRDRTPVMYAGEPKLVRLAFDESLLNTVIDFFGDLPKYTACKNGAIRCELKASHSGVKLFAMQYADKVEVLYPDSLRTEIAASLTAALAKYQPKPQEAEKE